MLKDPMEIIVLLFVAFGLLSILFLLYKVNTLINERSDTDDVVLISSLFFLIR